MTADENGVVTRTVSSLSILQAIRSAPVTTSRVLRRTRRADDVTLARHILAWHDEAEAEPSLLSPEPDSSIIAAANATIADLRDDLDDRAEQIEGLRDRCDDLFATGRAKEATITELRQEAKTSEALIETLRARVEELEPFEPRTGGLSIAPDGSPVIDVHFPEEFARLMLGNFRWYLDKHEAPNYVHMPMTDMGTGEQYWVTIGRPGGKSPHEMRVAAEGRAERAEGQVRYAAAGLEKLARPSGMTIAARAQLAAQLRTALDVPAAAGEAATP